MKYLENARLEALNSALSIESDDFHLDSRVESYSCKMVQSDKRQWKRTFAQPGTSPRDLQPLSAPIFDDVWSYYSNHKSAPSSFLDGGSPSRTRSGRSYSGSDDQDADEGPVLRDSISRKMLFDLIAVLNTSFDDYDFSNSKSDGFSFVPTLEKMLAMVPAYNRIRTDVWRTIDEEIKLSDCQIYSYNPDYSSEDPFSEDGCVWSFNYFFYNKNKKRILFFTCRALRDQTTADLSDEQLWSMEDHDD